MKSYIQFKESIVEMDKELLRHIKHYSLNV